jgi:hypothetical protein
LSGPEDEFDPAVNGDPDSTTGEEDEDEPNPFDEMADWDEPDFEPEDGDEDDTEGCCGLGRVRERG